MKYLFVVAGLLAAISLDAEKASQESHSDSVPVATEEIRLPIENHRLVLITDAEFVPFSQYFSEHPTVPDINNLPPSSAGPAKETRASLQRKQHRTP